MTGPGPIYVLSPDGQQTPCDIALVKQMLAEQTLTSDTYFWQEGMADWRPLRELQALPATTLPKNWPPNEVLPDFVPQKRGEGGASTFTAPEKSNPSPVAQRAQAPPLDAAPAPVAQKKRPIRRYEFEANPMPLTVAIQTCIALSLSAGAWFVYQCFSALEGWITLTHGDSVFLSRCFLGLFAFHWVIEILFFFWLYRTSKNCNEFARNMTYKPGWAVGCFFIPILNWFRPYQVLQEIWKVSKNPSSWLGARDSIFIGVWFGIRLLGMILYRGRFHTAYSQSDKIADQILDRVTYLATVQCQVILMEITSVILVSIVTMRMVRLVRQSEDLDEQEE